MLEVAGGILLAVVVLVFLPVLFGAVFGLARLLFASVIGIVMLGAVVAPLAALLAAGTAFGLSEEQTSGAAVGLLIVSFVVFAAVDTWVFHRRHGKKKPGL